TPRLRSAATRCRASGASSGCPPSTCTPRSRTSSSTSPEESFELAAAPVRAGRSPRALLLVGPGLLVAVVALALVGRGVGAPDAAPVDLAADVARAAPTALIADPTPSASPSPGWRSDWPAAIRGAQRLASDGYVNRF